MLRLAVQNVFWRCPNAYDVWVFLKMNRLAMLENSWRGISSDDWQNLKDKATESPAHAEQVDRAYVQRINAVIEEARQVLRQRDRAAEVSEVDRVRTIEI